MVFSGERERTINWHSILKDLEAKLDHTKVQGGLMWNSTTTKIGRKKIKEEKVYGPLETNIRHNAYILAPIPSTSFLSWDKQSNHFSYPHFQSGWSCMAGSDTPQRNRNHQTFHAYPNGFMTPCTTYHSVYLKLLPTCYILGRCTKLGWRQPGMTTTRMLLWSRQLILIFLIMLITDSRWPSPASMLI